MIAPIFCLLFASKCKAMIE